MWKPAERVRIGCKWRVKLMPGQNVLVDENPFDTIDNLNTILEFLCISLSNDDEVHEGYVLMSKTALDAAKTLRNNQMLAPAGVSDDTQKV
jgi:hypothetical protein